MLWSGSTCSRMSCALQLFRNAHRVSATNNSNTRLGDLIQNEKQLFLKGDLSALIRSSVRTESNFTNSNVPANLHHAIIGQTYQSDKIGDKIAKSLINGWLLIVDKMSGFENDKKSKSVWLSKLVLSQMFLPNPLLAGSMVYHTKAVLNPGKDLETVSMYLSHADNLRLSFTTLLELKNPNVFYRLITTIISFIDLSFCVAFLFPVPRFVHRTLAYLLEDTTTVFSKCLEEIEKDDSELKVWKAEKVPDFAVRYWNLKKDASLYDLLVAFRDDYARHTLINHVIASISRDEMRALRQ